MTAYLLAIFSAVSGAVANMMARGVARFAPARDYLAVNFGLMFLLLLPAAPFFWQLELSWLAVGVLLAASIIDLAANYFYFRSFESLDAVTASTILSISPLMSLLFVPLFRMEQGLGWTSVLGIILISGGLVLINRGKKNGEKVTHSPWRKYWLPLSAAVLFGFNVFVIKVLFTNQWTNPYTYYLLRAGVIAIAAYLSLKPHHSWLNRSAILFTVGRLAFVITQWLTLLFALDLGDPASVKALGDATPLFVLLLSGVVIKERITRWQVSGAAAVLAGMGMIALLGH